MCLTKEGYYNPKSERGAATRRKREEEERRGRAEEEGPKRPSSATKPFQLPSSSTHNRLSESTTYPSSSVLISLRFRCLPERVSTSKRRQWMHAGEKTQQAVHIWILLLSFADSPNQRLLHIPSSLGRMTDKAAADARGNNPPSSSIGD